VIDDSLGDEVRVTVIAAGFESGGPTHKKLEPQAFGAREKSDRPASGLIAPGVSGTTGPGNSSTAPLSTGVPITSASVPNQSGTLPPPAPAQQPGSPQPGYTPPAPRQPESPRQAETYRQPEPYRRDTAVEQAPAEPERAPYTPPAQPVADLDDDVDVPPFMKR